MNPRFLEAFLWIVRLKSFRAAAERLHVSQAAISSRISTLEEQLGCTLFDRQGDLRLTSAGRTLVAYAERIMEMQVELRRAVASQDAVTGTFRIGVVETVVHTVLVRILQALQAAHPSAAFEVTAEPTSALHDHLRRGTIDLAITTMPPRDPSVRSEPMCELVMGWITRGGDHLKPKTDQIDDLANEAIITFPAGSQPYQAVMEAFEAAQFKPKIVHSVTSIAAIMRLVRAGMGVASMPLAVVHEELASTIVRIVAGELRLPNMPLIVSHHDLPSDRVIPLVVDVIRSEIGDFADEIGSRLVRRTQR